MATCLFATYVQPGAEREAVLLQKSLRRFGGSLADSPVLGMTLAGQKMDLPGFTLAELKMPEKYRAFPFAAKVFAAAQAEDYAQKMGVPVVWMDADTLIFREPRELRLPPGIKAAACAVHHRLIGSASAEPPDVFWQQIYQFCGVAEENIFSVPTVADGLLLRAYFNAGLLVIDPASGLLNLWQKKFADLAANPAFTETFSRSQLHQIFFHQAVLAGVLLSQLQQAEVHLLPAAYNYPLHLHATMPQVLKITRLDEVCTARYDEYSEHPKWLQEILMQAEIRVWFEENWVNYV